MGIRRTTRSLAALAALLFVACGGGALALAACGESGGPAASAPSATPTPSPAARPEHLVGSDSTALTEKTVEAYTAVSNAGCARQGALYARDVVFHCFATGVQVEGRAALLELLQQVRAVTTRARALAGHASNGWAVVELRQDFEDGSIQLLQLIETRDGKILRLQNYYQPLENQVGPLRIARPLRSSPAPADTPAAAKAVALNYATALQAKDADAILALAAPDNDFRDTAGDSLSPAGELQHYAAIFKAPADLAFTHLRYVFGRGWAAVVWTASAAGGGGSGVTMLEIRDGKISRETLYYNGSTVPFSTTREAE